MPFEVVTKKRVRKSTAGTVRIQAMGKAAFDPDDLAKANIEHGAVIMVDVQANEIAIRRAIVGEEINVLQRQNERQHIIVGIRAALSALGIKDCSRSLGEYPVEHRDGMLVIKMGLPRAKPVEKSPEAVEDDDDIVMPINGRRIQASEPIRKRGSLVDED